MYPSVLKCTKCNKYYTFTPYIYKAYPLMEHHLSGVAAKVSLSLFHELAVLECFSKEHFLVKFIIKKCCSIYLTCSFLNLFLSGAHILQSSKCLSYNCLASDTPHLQPVYVKMRVYCRVSCTSSRNGPGSKESQEGAA